MLLWYCVISWLLLLLNATHLTTLTTHFANSLPCFAVFIAVSEISTYLFSVTFINYTWIWKDSLSWWLNKILGSEVTLPELAFQTSHVLALGPLANLTSLRLSFPKHKMGLMIVVSSKIALRLNEIIYTKLSAYYLVYSRGATNISPMKLW